MKPDPAEYKNRMELVDQVLALIRSEVERAVRKHRPMTSPHEGYAVILEELDELWAEVKRDEGRAYPALKEVIQVGAMAVRYATDVIDRYVSPDDEIEF